MLSIPAVQTADHGRDPEIALRIHDQTGDEVGAKALRIALPMEIARDTLAIDAVEPACRADPQWPPRVASQTGHEVMAERIGVARLVDESTEGLVGTHQAVHPTELRAHPERLLRIEEEHVDDVVAQAQGITRFVDHPLQPAGASVETIEPVFGADPEDAIVDEQQGS
jgi:hypothetical protein